MRENTLKQQLYDGKAAFGVMCTFPSPPVVEMLGYLGFDWILLDNEHGSITVDTAEGCIAAAELAGMAPIVRPATPARGSRAAPRAGPSAVASRRGAPPARDGAAAGVGRYRSSESRAVQVHCSAYPPRRGAKSMNLVGTTS